MQSIKGKIISMLCVLLILISPIIASTQKINSELIILGKQTIILFGDPNPIEL